MICMEGATAMMHQVKKRGMPATMVTCLLPNLAERHPPTRQAGRAATTSDMIANIHEVFNRLYEGETSL